MALRPFFKLFIQVSVYGFPLIWNCHLKFLTMWHVHLLRMWISITEDLIVFLIVPSFLSRLIEQKMETVLVTVHYLPWPPSKLEILIALYVFNFLYFTRVRWYLKPFCALQDFVVLLLKFDLLMLCVLLCLSLSFQNVVVFPSRTAAIENALRLFSPNLAIVDELLTRNLPREWMTSLAIEV